MNTLTWPATAQPLGLSQDELTYLDTFINLNSAKIKATLGEKRCFTVNPNTILDAGFVNDSDPSCNKAPCRTLYHLLNDVLVDADEMVGKGSQTEAYKYYSPKSGKFYVAKNLPEDARENKRAQRIYRMLQGKPGCVSYYYMDSQVVIEPYYNSTLKQELLQENIKTAQEKIDLLAKLVFGIKSIHDTCFVEKWRVGDNIQEIAGPLSHRDLQPSNIFIHRDDGCLQVGIGDYGYVGATYELIYSRNFLTPQIAQMDPDASQEHKIHFNRYLGVQNDIWQLGLLFFSVLENRVILDDKGRTLPPLKCFERTLNYSLREQAEMVANLSQDEIDKDINDKINSVNDSPLPENEKGALTKCWKIVQEMLQVEAHKRIHIGKIEKKLAKAAKLIS